MRTGKRHRRHDEELMADQMETRDMERGNPKRVLRDDLPGNESAVAASDAQAEVRPKQLN